MRADIPGSSIPALPGQPQRVTPCPSAGGGVGMQQEMSEVLSAML